MVTPWFQESDDIFAAYRQYELHPEPLEDAYQRLGLIYQHIDYLDANLSRIEKNQITIEELLDPEHNLLCALAYHHYRFFQQFGAIVKRSTLPVSIPSTYFKYTNSTNHLMQLAEHVLLSQSNPSDGQCKKYLIARLNNVLDLDSDFFINIGIYKKALANQLYNSRSDWRIAFNPMSP